MAENEERNRFERLEFRWIRAFEYILAAFMFVIVAWGLVMLILTTNWAVVPDDELQLHVIVGQILSDILLLVVGLEFAILLIHRRIEYLVDVVLFVVARKMLIGSYGAYEILAGVIAIAALYAVRKYLLICPGCRFQPLGFLAKDKEA